MATRLLVLCCDSRDHLETLGRTLADGASGVDGVKVDLKRIPGVMSGAVPAKVGTAREHQAPAAEREDLMEYDGIIFGALSGALCREMRDFFEQTGESWLDDCMVGKIGSVFAAAGKGRREATNIASFHASLRYRGMVIVELPEPCRELLDHEDCDGDHSGAAAGFSVGAWRPSENALAAAHFQGRHVAQVTRWLVQRGV